MKIKNIAFIICLQIILTGAYAQMNVEGHISHLTDTMVVFQYKIGKKTLKKDTVPVMSGKFVWQSDIINIQKINGVFFPSKKFLTFYAENSNIKISGDANALNLYISGSESEDESKMLDLSLKKNSKQKTEIRAQLLFYAKEEEKENLKKKLTKLEEQRYKQIRQHILAHPKSLFSLNLIQELSTFGDYNKINSLYMALDDSTKKTQGGKQIAERLPIIKRMSTGTSVLNFSQQDTSGKIVSYADFKGKYVFIDFWASWCGFCRIENSNILKTYNKYKDKNFTVVGISLDSNADKWKKAIKEDKTPWTQLSDLKGRKNEIAVYYGIWGIPRSILIDPEGKIIAKDLRGEELSEKLAEIFD